MTTAYRAMVSSDWNQCLAPSGPFDIIAHLYPQLQSQLDTIFGQYTGNRIPLSDAMVQVEQLLPEPIHADQMDAFLKDHFAIYPGVFDFIQTCRKENILFMINTTAIIGYFQRATALGLLPSLEVLSAHPLVRYDLDAPEADLVLPLLETSDKGRNTAIVAERYGIPFEKIIIIGDSGGDGPHFEWGAQNGASLISSMTKTSLADYCRQRGITIDYCFGHSYAPGEKVYSLQEQAYHFMDLWPTVEKALSR
jgi:2-hydroxy-3-keto-5-methylthiopentenyl-1-phosphate phosphatase